MAIDFEATSFGFKRREEFVKDLVHLRDRVRRRIENHGHESLAGLQHLADALDAVLNDDVFEPHIRRLADSGREPKSSAV